MDLSAFKLSDLQNCLALLTLAEGDGVVDARFLRERIQRHIAGKRRISAVTMAKYRRRPDNITTCSICGSPAVIVPVNNRADNQIGGGYTHAIQCQNRPATGQAWQSGHCGHTEYIVRGIR